jgi:hypothetical protein
MSNSEHLHNEANERPTAEKMITDYLNGRLLPAEEHSFEKKVEKDRFLQEALEGLSGLPPQTLPQLKEELNHLLKNKVKAKKHNKRKAILPSYIIFALILLLLLLIASFLLLQKVL